MSPYRTILVDVRADERIATITLNRPERRNAIDLAMVEELGAALGELAARDDVAALVLTGAGDKAFAAGADIAELLERTREDALRRINASLFARVEAMPQPTIAAIRGYALGGGCELALACDLRVAGESAKLGLPEVSLGIIPGAGGTYRLPRLVGLGKARELVFTGATLDARAAERIGLVNRVVPDAQVLDAALDLARTIAAQGPLAVRLAKVCLDAAARGAPESEIAVLAQAACFESEDKRRRMQAFLDRKAAKKEPPSSR